MELKNNISVIIPVYNAALFVRKAVESALAHEEVGEVVLIEDGSKDQSLEVCKLLESDFDKVHLYMHEFNTNKGAGISRNVGIKNAKYDFIAFLDADDVFLENRFSAEKVLFKENKNIDGIYGALGFLYYSQNSKQKFLDNNFKSLTTLSASVPPEKLFDVLVGMNKEVDGHFSLDTLTLKKNVFDRGANYFSSLMLHQDTAFLIQLANKFLLKAGKIDVAIGLRGVHENNRIINPSAKINHRLKMWEYLYKNTKGLRKENEAKLLFEAYYAKCKILSLNRVYGIVLLMHYFLFNKVFRTHSKFFNEPATRVFGEKISIRLISFKNRHLGNK